MNELTRVGGRKAIVLFSDGMELLPDINNPKLPVIRDPITAQLLAMMRRIVDRADRAGVVIYTIDARGLLYVKGPATVALWGSQQGLEALAEPTGGTATVNSNGLSDAMQRIENDMQGYYLIGFKAPPGIAADSKGKIEFHSLKVKVKVHGLHVHSRAGFLGETDAAARPKLTTPAQQMRAAMFSLFNQSAIHVRLTALYTRTTGGQAAVRNLIYVDPRDLTFKPDKSGKRKAVLDVVIIATGSHVNPLATLSRKIEVDANAAQLKRLDRSGIVLSFDIPVKQPGPYQVRDAASAAIGSAGQYIDIPNMRKQHLVLTTPVIDNAAVPANKRFKDSSSV
ncbi:MAG: VWA domain-containing protein, partial [Bryobacteraceae bacterium]